ncbi:NUDIX hydrolase [Streptomyces somaliensis]|uniref:NUDIX hydrolase n=1 Tax=Streptomyces somaliensis (strain ATCC 33201 / DSM 40738 / JCM 12659 / KCTC 9044 / NCTC 11332 / NRRL B-12077 / IP 733) TaxID=1134445 RepID=A0AA44DAB0_STRE0|nr:NUDIX hydrolase [Streptomyces somaliensis]MCP9944352.1 NUDIX hydrolase [Streptomyces somaliensis]MCP9962412.1 NUDIX hydrolase [Streptomyces somaliensis]MCQ0023373.1 NUDIX hydrolase [Streptomyces somaliensis DSM 40738]NKY12798.1 NUDIX hydrolase [Streptomyces somaliensis DSM 40738]
MNGRAGVVRAAGCVLWRRTADGAVEVCLVHRPKYDDWSFPKGKVKAGEELRAAAVREVREETGRACEPGARLGTVRYRVGAREKEVTYWSAEAGPGSFTPGGEVDALRWLPAEEARELLSHPQDRALIGWFLATP